MERALALLHRDRHFPAQDVNAAVVGHLEVIDACHDRGEVVVGCVGRFAGLAHDGEHGCQVFETWGTLVRCGMQSSHVVTYLQ
jgi:hypothetical protein